MMQFDLDEHDHIIDIGYNGTDGEKYSIEADVVDAHEMLMDAYDAHPDSIEEQNKLIIAWAEGHGGKNMSKRQVFLLGHYILEAYEDFKKKASATLKSLRPTLSTPSLLQQLKDGHLKLAGTESTPNENSETETPPQTSPPNASTA